MGEGEGVAGSWGFMFDKERFYSKTNNWKYWKRFPENIYSAGLRRRVGKGAEFISFKCDASTEIMISSKMSKSHKLQRL